MFRSHPIPFAVQARIALFFGITASFGAAALCAALRSDFGAPPAQLLAVALTFVAFAFISWHAAEAVCKLGEAGRRASFERAVETMTRKRTAHLETANIELMNETRTDSLTGLLNRRGFDEQARKALASARRRKGAMSVVMLDIDHFKRVNDTFGHAIGDAVIKTLAHTLVGRLRDTDIIARIGGEEFAIILTDTDAAGAVTVARGILSTVQALRVARVGEFTVSAGVASARPGHEGMAGVIARADEALYMAKDQGPSQVCIQELLPESLAHPVKLRAVA